MADTDFVVRSWRRNADGTATATVVDMRGQVAHVTVTAYQAAHGELEHVIRRRLAARPPRVRSVP